MVHTEVPDAYAGQGLASALGRVSIAREQGFKLVLRCSFLEAWYARHPEYGDVVAG
jgi:predicted GNAT family acetyltransferase